MPVVGLFVGGVDLAGLFYLLDESRGIPVSLADAKAKGIPVLAYGAFLNDIMNFLIIAFIVFLLIRQLARMRLKEEAAAPAKKECPQCLSSIPLGATRCAFCSVDLKAA